MLDFTWSKQEHCIFQFVSFFLIHADGHVYIGWGN